MEHGDMVITVHWFLVVLAIVCEIIAAFNLIQPHVVPPNPPPRIVINWEALGLVFFLLAIFIWR